MKKITFFLSLLLTVVGITTTQAQNTTTPEKTLLEPSDLTDGRVIALKACANANTCYMRVSDADLEKFDPRETALVVEYDKSDNEDQTNKFYLKNFSDGSYLQIPTGYDQKDGTTVTLGTKEGAALFYVISVSRSGSDNSELTEDLKDVTADDVIRFVTTAPEGQTVYFNCNNPGQKPRYHFGKGSFSVFCVYDAAELCCKLYGKNLGEQPVYVGDPIHSEIQEQAMYAAFQDYDGSPSEDNYNAVLAAAESDKGKFDPNLYYVIENNNTRGVYIENSGTYIEDKDTSPNDTDTKILGWSRTLSGKASQIWRFEPDDTNAGEVQKYYMTSQGVYCSEPSKSKAVKLSGKETSFYLINSSVGVYAFDSQVDHESVMTDNGGENTGTGIHLPSDRNVIVGWCTKPDPSKWKLRYARTYNLDISSAQWASLNLPFAVELPEELTAYYAVGENEDNTAIVLEDAGAQIPANFPVVIKSNDEITESEGKTFSLTILPASTEVASPASDGNKFSGTLLPALQDGEDLIYALGDSDDGVCFYQLDDEDRTIPANKAYYDATKNGDGNSVNALRFSFGTATGIAGASASAPSASRMWFDLKGRRVLYPGKGIYVNAAGEKVLFK